MTKDYYQILNLTEFSTSEDIKNAYRRLARKWHPDIAGNTPDVLSKFKEINEAYEILSNTVKKADYDSARKFYNYAKQGSSYQEQTAKEYSNAHSQNESNTSYHDNKKGKRGFSFNWEEFITKKYGEAQFKKEVKTAKRGDDIYSDIEITAYDAIHGTTKIVNMLQTTVCHKCGGRKFVNGTSCPHCKGKGEISTYKRFNVKIPAGIKDKSKIRLAGEGEQGINGGRSGDLYLIIHILELKDYKVEGLNIYKTIQISPADAVLGCEKEVETTNGRVFVKISPQIHSGQKIRLSGCGITHNGKVGNMILTIEIQIPQNLTNEEIALYKKLQSIRKK